MDLDTFDVTTRIPDRSREISAVVNSDGGELVILYNLAIMASLNNADVRTDKALVFDPARHEPLRDATGAIVYQRDAAGNLLLDAAGQPVPVPLVRRGEDISYTIKVDNRLSPAPDYAEALQVITTDQLPAGFTYRRAEVSYDGGTQWTDITAQTTPAPGVVGPQNITFPTVRRLDQNGLVWGGTDTVATLLTPASAITTDANGRRTGRDLTYRITVTPTTDGRLINAAQASTGSVDNNQSNNSDTVPTQVGSTQLNIEKAASGPLIAGQPGQYTLSVSNVGGFRSVGAITIQEALPAGMTITSATASDGSTVALNGTTLTFTPATPLAPNTAAAGATPNGGAVTITLNVNVPAGATGTLTNRVSVGGGGDPDPIPAAGTCAVADPQCAEAVTTISAPQLEITKVPNGTFVAGRAGSYTVTVTNRGTAPTSGPITVSDALPAGMTFVSATSAQGTVTGTDPLNLTFTPSAALQVGASATITVNVNVSSAAATNLTNRASVGGGGDPDPTPVPGGCTTTVGQCAVAPTPITRQSDLSIVKSNGVSQVSSGTQTTYTVTVTNNGPSDVPAGAVVTDTVADGLEFIGITPGAGQTVNGTAVTLPAMVVGATQTFTVTARIPATKTSGNVSNTVVVTPPSGTTDPNSDNDRSTDSDPVQPVNATLAVTKTAESSYATYTVQPGTPSADGTSSVTVTVPTLTYTIRVENTSGVTATGVTVSDTLPAGLTNVVVTGPNPATTQVASTAGPTTANQVLSWTAGDLTAGNAVTYTVTAQAPAAASLAAAAQPAALVNRASATGSNVTPPTPSEATVNTVYSELVKRVRNVGANKALTPPFSSTAQGQPGEFLEYCLDYANYGSATLPAFQVRDTLDPRSVFDSLSPSSTAGRSVTPDNGTVVSDSFTLPAGVRGSVCFYAKIY
ncbi:hypothetical protein ACFP81_07115 [Deinococcus lacus]|uniref:DUF11 domain-containing protein n=1 Tax=Deinococcus lacus TaxID=392561 RepID=A0ABW1YE16_9DEIO